MSCTSSPPQHRAKELRRACRGGGVSCESVSALFLLTLCVGSATISGAIYDFVGINVDTYLQVTVKEAVPRSNKPNPLAVLLKNRDNPDFSHCTELSSAQSPMRTVVQVKDVASDMEPTLNFSMTVYQSGDIVSERIQQLGHWEKDETEFVLKKLHDASSRTKRPRGKTLLLDIGANIGWFTLVAAMSGFRVVAFEPFVPNYSIVKTNLCDLGKSDRLYPDLLDSEPTVAGKKPPPPKSDRSKGANAKSAIRETLKSRVEIFNRGLGAKEQKCEMWQNPSTNYGDTHTVCTPIDDKSREEIAKQQKLVAELRAKGLRKLGDSHIVTLDQAMDAGVFREKVSMMKMDVEGYEPNVLAGGERFFKSRFAPESIVMETDLRNLNAAWGKEHGADQLREMLAFLRRHGYFPGSWAESAFYRLLLPFLGNERNWKNFIAFLIPANSVFERSGFYGGE